MLTGNAVDNTLTGNGGADTFVFEDEAGGGGGAVFGSDAITDFSREEGDRIDLSGLGLAEAEVLAAITTDAGDSVVTLGDSEIRVVGVADLQGADFVLA